MHETHRIMSNEAKCIVRGREKKKPSEFMLEFALLWMAIRVFLIIKLRLEVQVRSNNNKKPSFTGAGK